ncbi:MAG: ABC transporter substrate-binding protein [Deinococcota bacterium]
MKKLNLVTFLVTLMLAGFSLAQDTRTVTDDLGRSVDIPAVPTAIASLDDLRLTLPLIELGAPLVASHGRTTSDGDIYIRSAEVLTGANFDNTGITFLGNSPLDVEALAAAQPDLIVTLVSRDSPLEQLEAIAPTVVFDEDVTDRFAIYGRLAELTGTESQLAVLEARYQAQLTQLIRLVDTSAITISVMEGSDGAIAIEHTYGSLGRVLRDAGFGLPDLINGLEPGGGQEVSAEFLPQLDADIIFDTYRGDRNETPADAHARMMEVLASYCDVLTACSGGRYYRIPRDEAKAISFNALATMTTMLQTILSAPEPVGQ